MNKTINAPTTPDAAPTVSPPGRLVDAIRTMIANHKSITPGDVEPLLVGQPTGVMIGGQTRNLRQEVAGRLQIASATALKNLGESLAVIVKEASYSKVEDDGLKAAISALCPSIPGADANIFVPMWGPIAAITADLAIVDRRAREERAARDAEQKAEATRREAERQLHLAETTERRWQEDQAAKAAAEKESFFRSKGADPSLVGKGA